MGLTALGSGRKVFGPDPEKQASRSLQVLSLEQEANRVCHAQLCLWVPTAWLTVLLGRTVRPAVLTAEPARRLPPGTVLQSHLVTPFRTHKVTSIG